MVINAYSILPVSDVILIKIKAQEHICICFMKFGDPMCDHGNVINRYHNVLELFTLK